MKLGPGLDLIETVTLHGIVDVYKVNGERIARKWPCKPKQPRTAEQEAHWAKVRACMEWRRGLPSWWLSWWKSVNVPIGYSWDDILRRSWWRSHWVRTRTVSDTRINTFGWKAAPGNPFWLPGLYINSGFFDQGLYMLRHGWFHPVKRDQTLPLKWILTGYKCYRGKKRKPQYEIDLNGYSPALFYGGGAPPWGWNMWLGDIPEQPYYIIGMSVTGYERNKPETIIRPGTVYNDWIEF